MLGTIRKNKREIPEWLESAKDPGTADFAKDHNKMLISYVLKKNNQNLTIDDETGKPVVVLD